MRVREIEPSWHLAKYCLPSLLKAGMEGWGRCFSYATSCKQSFGFMMAVVRKGSGLGWYKDLGLQTAKF